MPDILDRMVHDALTIAPTSWVDAVKRGVSWQRPEAKVCALAQTPPNPPKRHPILQWFCAWLRPKP
jgi:hypothetical protein